MAAKDGATGSSTLYRPYFFLSYAHSPSLADYSKADPDRWVRRLFGDLATAVKQQASPQRELIPGFFDQEIPPGSGWKESRSQALRTAQVFVPLYSAGYFAKSWSRRERDFFLQRMQQEGLANPEGRVVPVLWAPLPKTQNPPGLRQALELGAGEPGYTENGLRALLRIRSCRDSYQAVVNLLAKRIVDLAEDFPIEPSEVLDIDETKSGNTPATRLAVFAIETAAPTARTVAAGRDPRGYGESSTEWRPFPQQKSSLAEYASQVAERFDFEAKVSGIRTVTDPRTRRPGIILIDPWFVADEKGRSALESAVEDLPRWVLPLLVLDRPDDPRTQELADQVRDILDTAKALPTESSRDGARGVSSLDEFFFITRVLVTEAERQYLRYRSSGKYRTGQVPSPSGNRPSLRHLARQDRPASPPERPTSAQDPLGETPDA